MIELHDAGIVVHVEDLPREELGWRDSPTVVGKRFSIDGNELGRLLQSLGLTFDAEMLYGDEFDLLFRRPIRTGDVKPDVPISDVLRIKELKARIDGPHVLHLQLTAHTTSEADDEFVQEITYSGSYSVWWSVAEE